MPNQKDATSNEDMLISSLPLTQEDFAHTNWQAVIEPCVSRVATSYALPFFNKASEVAVTGDKTQEAVYILLGRVCSPYMSLDNAAQPFKPTFTFSDGSRSPSVEDITDRHLQVLAEIFLTIGDAELRARVADILWIRKCKHVNNPGQWARIATRAYLDSAQVLEDPIRFIPCVHRLERAMQLIASSRDSQEQFIQVIAYIEILLTKYSDEDQTLFSYKLMKLFVEQKQGDTASYALLSEKIARRAEDRSDWHAAAEYWRMKARWHQLAGDIPAAQQALECEAETLIKDAIGSTQAPHSSYMRASSLLYEAITALEQLPDTGERRKQLKAQLHE